MRVKNENLIRVEFRGETLTLTMLAYRTGLNLKTLASRYARGDRGDQLMRSSQPRENSLAEMTARAKARLDAQAQIKTKTQVQADIDATLQAWDELE